MEKVKKSILDDNVVITFDNIEVLSKAIATRALKTMRRYAYSSTQFIDTLYKNLMKDFHYHKKLDSFSSAYDLVQEASCFLCKYIGRKLGEICQISKTRIGKVNNIRMACFKSIYAYLRKEMKHINDLDNEEYLEFVFSDEKLDKEPVDYSKVKLIVKNIIHTKLEAQIFTYYYDSVPPKLIAEFLHISTNKVYKRRRKFKDRYFNYLKRHS